jgi:nucleotide-binding universal stress UspA family protein
MFKKILFATSGSPASDNAAKVAFDLARREKAKLIVFHVVGVPTRGFSTLMQDNRTGAQEEIDTDYRDWVVEELKTTYANQLADYSDNVYIKTANGVPGTEVLRFARQEDVDLIVMGANTRDEETGSSRNRQIIGNTMQRVAKTARCPVLIVNRPCTTCWRMFSNIVFSTDFSKAADSAFMFAYNTARDIGAKLYVFHAVDLSAHLMGLSAGQLEIERLIDKAKQTIQDRYVSKMTDYDNFETEVREGTPFVEILKYSREKQADLVVMAHHTKDVSPEEAEIGSTVEQVVLRSACPVASVVHMDKVAVA